MEESGIVKVEVNKNPDPPRWPDKVDFNTEFTPKELAARWRLSVKTLATWRCKKWKGYGPNFNKRGRKVTYSLEEILKYERDNKSDG